jgi:hypothetical protein
MQNVILKILSSISAHKPFEDEAQTALFKDPVCTVQ